MDHDFGAKHTQVKLTALKKYLPAYTTALKDQPFKLSYIDAFAGTGTCLIKTGADRKIRIPGSAQIALECRPPFDRAVFIESRKRHAEALRRLKDRESGRAIDIIQGDANAVLPSVLSRLERAKDRAVVFLDPYGMAVDWTTLQAIRRSELADVWYLFPLSGLYRQAANSAALVDEGKATRLTRMLGTDRWRTEFYKADPQLGLFGSPDDIRDVDVDQMSNWVTKRLEALFPKVLPPKILYQTMPSGARGAPLFSLYFAMSNPSPKAWALASRLASHVLKD